jgi:hypothetical protein
MRKRPAKVRRRAGARVHREHRHVIVEQAERQHVVRQRRLADLREAIEHVPHVEDLEQRGQETRGALEPLQLVRRLFRGWSGGQHAGHPSGEVLDGALLLRGQRCGLGQADPQACSGNDTGESNRIDGLGRAVEQLPFDGAVRIEHRPVGESRALERRLQHVGDVVRRQNVFAQVDARRVQHRHAPVPRGASKAHGPRGNDLLDRLDQRSDGCAGRNREHVDLEPEPRGQLNLPGRHRQSVASVGG